MLIIVSNDDEPTYSHKVNCCFYTLWKKRIQLLLVGVCNLSCSGFSTQPLISCAYCITATWLIILMTKIIIWMVNFY